MRAPARALLGLFAALAACESTGEGTLVVTAYGESFIEDGIPASEVGDGWAIAFERFHVTFGAVTFGDLVAAPSGAVDLAVPSGGEGHPIGAVEVLAGDHAEPSYTIVGVEVVGVATKDDVRKSFHWNFDAPTLYAQCESVTSVDDGETGVFQITVHADHLFYDSLVAAEPNVLFQAIADADVDGDGDVTPAELAATDIGAYDPGSEGGVDDLWSWLVAQTRTLGHVDGEGHCHVAPAG